MSTAISIPATLPAFGGLTLKQSSFLDNFLTNPETLGHGTKSVIAAGYTDNPATAAVIASQLLRSLKIKQEIKRRLGKAIAGREEVLERLTDQARADLGQILQPDGSLDWQHARRKGKTKLLKKVKYDKDTGKLTEIELYDAQAALEKLGKFHGLFIERSESVNLNINVNRDDLFSLLQQSLEDID